jgi:hypothetical protein
MSSTTTYPQRDETIPGFTVDFIGIGAEKAATYWIADCLREHPEICFSREKEIAFFNAYDQHLLQAKNDKYKRGIGWYQSRFRHCQPGKLKGEYTPTYLYSREAASRIHHHFPQVKLIVCLRNPVKRAFSQYLHDRSIGLLKDITFEQALSQHSSYIEKGLYYKYLSYYFELFPRENILVLLVEDIRANKEAAVKSIYSFLGLQNQDFIPPSINKNPNTASAPRVAWLNYLLLHTEYFLRDRELTWVLNVLEDTGIRKAVFNFSYYINRKPLTRYPEMLDETAQKLRLAFREDIQNLEPLIQHDLSAWK